MKRIRRNAEESKGRILDEAIKVFSDIGFFEASFQKIADGCGVSQSAAIYHFPNKESLFEGVIKKIVVHNHEKVAQALSIKNSAMDQLTAHFQANLDWAINYPEEAQLILLLYYYGSFQKHFSKLYGELLVNARNRIKGFLYAAQRERLLSKDKNVDTLSEILHDALLGSIVNILASNASPTGTTKKKWKVLFNALIS